MTALYPRLALTGIRKNRKLYLPYLGTCTGAVSMYYIIHSLSFSPSLHQMKGGGVMEAILGFGVMVIAVFSLLFLLYTNSFLIRRRNKEFGLYHILGMGKSAIARILAWETLFVAAFSLAAGLGFGILLSKLAELLLLKFVRGALDYRITLSWNCISDALGMFGLIFLLLLLKSLWTVYRSDPLALLKSENLGEKPPRSKALLTVLGLIMLAVAYYFAVTIENPSLAVGVFFLLVLLVIAATYLLFISGSVTVCRKLQKNPRYYYQKEHFVSVSNMAFRMKRNGAGLASICILSTMVLVMLSSTSSLYMGAEDTLQKRYIRGSEIDLSVDNVSEFDDEHLDRVRSGYDAVFSKYALEPQNLLDFRYCRSTALQTGDSFEPGLTSALMEKVAKTDGTYENDLRFLFFLTAEDYSAISGISVSAAPGEVLLGCSGCAFPSDRLTIGSLDFTVAGDRLSVHEILNPENYPFPSILVVISDWEQIFPLLELEQEPGKALFALQWCYAYDLGCDDNLQWTIQDELADSLNRVDYLANKARSWREVSRSEQRQNFYMIYGSLFFIGILLSIVFIFATALIVYYKQVCEGYEDQARFSILQKVGMTRADIRKSVNSQVLTVFFTPLLAAGMHTAFAFPMIWKMLQLFDMRNLTLIILTTIGSFVLFGVFYVIIYWFTAGSYYSIVSDGRKA